MNYINFLLYSRSRYVHLIVLCCLVLVLCTDKNERNPSGPGSDNLILESSFIEASPEKNYINNLIGDLVTEYSDSISFEAKDIIDSAVDTENSVSKRLYGLTDSGSSSADSLIGMGIEAILHGSMKTALYCFLQAASMHPENPSYLSKTGFALKRRGRYAEARSILLYSRSIDSSYHETHANLAGVYEALGDLERAAYEWQAAILQYPGNYMYHLELAEIYKKQGLPSRAYSEYQRAEQLAPHLYTIRTMIASLGDTSEFDDRSAESIPIPDLEGYMNQSDLENSLEIISDTISKIILDINNRSYSELMELVGIEYNIEQDYLNDVSISASLCSDCGDTPACLSAHCSRCQTALNFAKSKVYPNAREIVSAYNNYIVELLRRTMSIYYSNPEAVDRNIAYYYINMELQSLVSGRDSVMPNTEELVSLWEEDAASVCNDAAMALEDARQDSIEAAKRGEAGNFEICVLVVCFGSSGDKISISATFFGFGSLGLSYDMKKEAVGISAGVSAFNAVGIGVSVNSNGDANVTTSARMPLPIGIKFSDKSDNISLF